MKHYSILFCLLLALGANSSNTAKAQVDVNDSLALVDLYNSTNGPGWKHHNNWLTTKPVSTWYGISAVTNTRVTFIVLEFNLLSGELPSSIGNLAYLIFLKLNNNQLSGAIPSTIGNLANVQSLILNNNQLSGNIPSTIGNLANLQVLHVYNNQLSGNIPSTIGNLSRLSALVLNNNQLSGNIPSTIGNLANLGELVLENNQLSGAIPSISNLTRLYALSLHHNQLSGSIPFIGNLVDLKGVYLNNNQLSGTIPFSIGNLVNLSQLYLNNNQLSGTIPPSIGKLVNLQYLRLFTNRLSGAIPASIGKLVQLRFLSLKNNLLSGELPRSFNQLKSLLNFDVSYNQLTLSSNANYLSSDQGNVVGHTNDNRFTFNSAEFVAQKFPKVVYAPQARIPIHQYGNSLAVYAGGTLSNNTYSWFKAGEPDSTIITGDSTFTPTQDGKYYVKVANAIATQLTLYSDTIDVTASNLTVSNRLSADANRSKVKQLLQVSPNPASSTVKVHVNGTATIILTNSSGKIMLTKGINNTGELNVSALANGMYYIQNKTTGEVQKLVVLH